MNFFKQIYIKNKKNDEKEKEDIKNLFKTTFIKELKIYLHDKKVKADYL